jgi:uncharacterized membrane protein
VKKLLSEIYRRSDYDASRLFMVAAPILYILYNLVSPPFQTPDELNHFYRAYQVSQGKFIAERTDRRVGGEVPVAFEEFALVYKSLMITPEQRISGKDFLDALKIKVDHRTRFKDFPNTAVYSPLCYIPQALALRLLSIFNAPVVALYYGGKLFIFTFWYLGILFVLRLLPAHRLLFAGLSLLPMQLYIVNSFSGDTITNVLAFVLIAQVLRAISLPSPLTRQEVFLMCLVVISLVFTKVVYSVLILLLIMIPARNFKGRRRKLLLIGALVFLVGLLVLWWTTVIKQSYILYQEYNPEVCNIANLAPGANYQAQLIFLSEYPLQAMNVIWNTLTAHFEFYLGSYAGNFGAYLGMPVPHWYTIVLFSALILIAFFEPGGTNFSPLQRGVLGLTSFVLFSAITLSLYVVWIRVGGSTVDSIQGRYLIPLFPMVFLAFSSPLQWSGTRLLVLATVILLNFYVIKSLHHRFVEDNYAQTTRFRCDFEKMNQEELFYTSAPQIQMQGVSCVSARGRNGGRCVALDSACSAAAIFPIANFRQGDQLIVSVWRKGESGRIVFAGCGGGCEEFYFLDEMPQFEDIEGWSKISMTLVMPVACDNPLGVLYLSNHAAKKARFDDLDVIVKKGVRE